MGRKVFVSLSIMVYIILVAFGECVVAQEAPSIGSVSGAVADGGSVTISGLGFGATGPTIYKWDAFEGDTHTVGENVGVGPGSISWIQGSSYNPCKVSNSANRGVSTKHCRSRWAGQGSSYWKSGIYTNYGGAIPSPVYVTWWWRYSFGEGDASTNWKPHWPIAADTAKPDMPRVSMCYMGSSGVHVISASSSEYVSYWHDRPPEDNWIRAEFYGVESDPGIANGTVIWKTQWSTDAVFSTIFNRVGDVITRISSDDHWGRTFFGEYVRTETGSEFLDLDIDFDDVYIANSRARVEISDNSNFDLCTHREIQIPTVWSDGSITFTTNQGSFQDGETAYLFVVDENGTVNEEGYEITIGQAPQGPYISSAPSNINHGDSITITGGGFGAKAQAAPLQWDDCESGSVTDNWNYRYPNACAISDSNMHYDTTAGLGQGVAQAHSHSTQYAVGRADIEGTTECGSGFNNMKGPNVLLGKSITGTTYSYASYYYRHDPLWGGGTANYKLARWTKNSPLTITEGDSTYFSYSNTPPNPNYRWHTNSYVHDIFGTSENGADPGAGWIKTEIVVYHANPGYIKVYENGNLIADDPDPYFIGDVSGTDYSIWVFGGFKGRASSQGGYCTGWENDFFYFDDLYYDNTPQRVIIGNAPTLDSSNIREIQIPSAWADGSITVNVNQGSFANGETAYLFVVDENDEASAGYPISFGGASDCGNENCDPGECTSCPGDCTLGQCCGIEGCNSPVGEDCDTCHQDCGCTSPEICCSGQCIVPACYQDSDCGSNPCKTYTCNSPGTCSASCSEQDITSCIDDDGCCPPGCTEEDDSDCMAADYCDGLALLMHLDNQPEHGETANHVYDFSGNGNNGTVTGATHSPSGGMFDGAYLFDGNSDYISISHDPSLDVTDGLTLAAWVYPTSITDYDYIISRASNTSGSPYVYYALGFDSSTERLRMRIFTDSAYQAVSQVITPGQWYHVAGTYSASQNNLSIYINGILAGSIDASGLISVNDKDVLIGIYEYGPAESWNGYIDEVAVWNRSLSAQEVQGLYSSGMPLTCFHRADADQDGCIVMGELIAFIDRWKISSQDVPMWEMMEAVGLWKAGAGCTQ